MTRYLIFRRRAGPSTLQDWRSREFPFVFLPVFGH